MAAAMNCEEANDLLALDAVGALEPSERDEMERHVATCAACRQLAAQYVDADRIGLDAVALALQHRLDDETQKRAELRRAIEIVARRHAFELGSDLVRRRQIAGRFVHRSGNPQMNPVRGH